MHSTAAIHYLGKGSEGLGHSIPLIFSVQEIDQRLQVLYALCVKFHTLNHVPV